MTASGGPVAEEIYSGPGFVGFGIESVVKFGGSLLRDVHRGRAAFQEVTRASTEHPVLVFPGGGPWDDLVERYAREIALPTDLINPACMRALDQTGILLAATIPDAEAVEDLAAARQVLARDATPVLLPSRLILSLDVFTRFDVITSDTLGAFFAFLVGARRYVVLTDVDGVLDLHRASSADGGRLIKEVTAHELANMGKTSVDACLGPFLHAVGLDALIVNGGDPSRVRDAITGGRPHGTRIRA